jgi:hypothetical protein
MPIHSRHSHVGEQRVEMARGTQRQCIGCACRRLDFIARA